MLTDTNLWRVKRLDIAPELLLQWITSGRPQCRITDNLPDDAKIVDAFGCDYLEGRHEARTISLLIESETFEEIPNGTPAPILSPPSFHETKLGLVGALHI